jgi:hypothetical protein
MIELSAPDTSKAKNLEEKVRMLEDYCSRLRKELTHLMEHLDENNISPYAKIKAAQIGSVFAERIDASHAKIQTAQIEELEVGKNVIMGPDAAISWSQVTGAPSIPVLPGYIKSTYIDSTTVMSPSIVGGTISVTTDVYVGDGMYLNWSTGTVDRGVYFGNTGVSIEGNSDYGFLGYGMVITAPQTTFIGDVNLCADNSGYAFYNSEEIATKEWVQNNFVAL